MHNITIAEFMATVFPPEEMQQGHAPLLSYPEADYYRQLIATPRACKDADRRRQGWLFCVSTVVLPEPGGKAKRSMNEVREAWVIVFDDIGTKADAPPAFLTWLRHAPLTKTKKDTTRPSLPGSPGIPAFGTRTEPPQGLERIEAGVVAVTPDELEGIFSDVVNGFGIYPLRHHG